MYKNLLPILSVLVIANLLFTLYHIFFQPNLSVAYVRSHDLVYNYQGMKEAQSLFELNQKEWKSNLDTLKADFQQSLNYYKNNIDALGKKNREKLEVELELKQNNIISYTENIQQKYKAEDEKMTQGVLNQINDFVEKYGEAKGYDIVLGTTLSGSLIYGNEAIDITEEVLYALNQNYLGR